MSLIKYSSAKQYHDTKANNPIFNRNENWCICLYTFESIQSLYCEKPSLTPTMKP